MVQAAVCAAECFMVVVFVRLSLEEMERLDPHGGMYDPTGRILRLPEERYVRIHVLEDADILP